MRITRDEPARILGKPEQIGCDRLYETYVFELGKKPYICECGCGVPRPSSMSEIDSLPANTGAEANANHLALCRKYARLKEAK